MAASAPMPAAFLGHGNPMNALDHNRYTEAWQAFGTSVPTPRAILVVSAHWYINATAVTAMKAPRTIHDFYGFPDELFAVEYPAPGDPEVAGRGRRRRRARRGSASTTTAGASTTAPGRCSCHAFPEADVPVLQLSINAMQPFEYHLELGADAGAAARARACWSSAAATSCTTSGGIDWSKPDVGFDWSQRFDDAARRLLTSDPSRDAVAGRARRLRRRGADAGPLPPDAVPRRPGGGRRHAGRRAGRRLRDGLAVDDGVHPRPRPEVTGQARAPLPCCRATSRPKAPTPSVGRHGSRGADDVRRGPRTGGSGHPASSSASRTRRRRSGRTGSRPRRPRARGTACATASSTGRRRRSRTASSPSCPSR